MRNARRNRERSIETPIIGMGVVLASALCFLVYLSLLIVLARLVL